MPEEEIGRVAHYFNKIDVAAVELSGNLSVGDTIHVKGHTSDWTQEVKSIQIEHETVESAGPGDSIGIKVDTHTREHEIVYKVTD